MAEFGEKTTGMLTNLKEGLVAVKDRWVGIGKGSGAATKGLFMGGAEKIESAYSMVGNTVAKGMKRFPGVAGIIGGFALFKGVETFLDNRAAKKRATLEAAEGQDIPGEASDVLAPDLLPEKDLYNGQGTHVAREMARRGRPVPQPQLPSQ